MKKMKKANIRVRLIASFLLIVFLTGIFSMLLGIQSINKNIIREAYESVRNSLMATKFLYNQETSNLGKTISYLSKTEDISRAVVNKNRKFLFNKLKLIKKEFGFDIINITDSKGRIIVRANNFYNFNDNLANNIFIKGVLKKQKSINGTDIIDQGLLKKENDEIVARSIIMVKRTPYAQRKGKTKETKAMVLKAVSPIYFNKHFVGIIYGSVLVNRNFDLVDRYRNLVFRDEKYNSHQLGTTTIFLGDIRIATNVIDGNGKRAIGTRVSDVVNKRIFVEKKIWLDKAFVVDKWYLSGYSPIYSIDNKTIGILYVGILEDKYDDIVKSTTIYFLILMVITTFIAIALAVYLINTITKPVKRFVLASTKISEGDYSKIEIEPDDDQDMIYMVGAYNNMVEAIVDKDNKLKEQAEKTILKSEKLASLGRLASGIAHEINNPLTGVLTYSSILLEELKGTKHIDDLMVIRNETIRCRDIVRGVLDFARETKLERVRADANTIIDDCLLILEKHVNFQNIVIKKNYNKDLPEIFVDVNQLKQVINNLCVNAADSMAEGGFLTITTMIEHDFSFVVMKFADTGSGINDDDLGKIYDPFFTTKSAGKGTGLGLAVTYGIIKHHGGKIEVASKIDEGTEFAIYLPVECKPD